MINWDDPDYQAAGHFYALIKSITVNCSDPTPIASNVTSYVYGGNTTSNTPSIDLSNASTVNGALGAMSAVSGPWGIWTVSCAVLFSLVGAALA